MKYFIFNKNMDYERGKYINLLVEDAAIRVEHPSAGTPGIFLSRILDSREEEMVWHRLVMESDCGDNMAVYLKIYAADSVEQAQRDWEGCRERWLDRRQVREEVSPGTGGRILAGEEPTPCLETRNPRDILLHQVKGRFLWFLLILYGNGRGSPVVRGMKLYFPRETWMRFLPEVYQGEAGEFLERYLCIFQSIYDSLGQRIERDADYLDIQAADPGQLRWLAEWISTSNSHLWKQDNLRQYLALGAAVYRNLGTPGALVHMVELYTGFRPYLKEPGQGEDPNLFQIYIPEEAVASPRQYQALLRIIREGKPADMEVQVVALKSFVFLDQDTYLGINSELNTYGQAMLDSGSSMSYAVLGGRGE